MTISQGDGLEEEGWNLGHIGLRTSLR